MADYDLYLFKILPEKGDENYHFISGLVCTTLFIGKQ